MSENTPVVSNDEAELVEALHVVETKKQSKAKRESKRAPKKPQVISVSVENATINFDDNTVHTEQLEPDVETVPKAKARPKNKSKTTVVEQVTAVESTNISTTEKMNDVVEIHTNKQTVSSPNCHKVMAPKTLKYNHKHICPAKEHVECVKNSPIEQIDQDLLQVLT
ncbi:MAG: hypothetical protein ACKPKO_08505, partial [Candidatus Fonsibacter sp.]